MFSTFKYGILIKNRYLHNSKKWLVALFGGSVTEHGCIEISERSFEFSPNLGDSVKVGFENVDSLEPSVFAIVYLSQSNLRTSFQRRDQRNGRYYYIIENEETDFRRVSIPKEIVDYELLNRSDRQKIGEPIVYRVGLCYEPANFENGLKVKWRLFEDSNMIPIFELYSRDSMLPYLSESMVYGALEGVVISVNEDGALFWTPRMGCCVLSSVTSHIMPNLGSVNLLLVKRCLVDSSFGFPCFYELLPSILQRQWPDVKLIADSKNGCIYFEVCCQCVRLVEDEAYPLCMNVPHLGKIKRGLESNWNRLTPGREYSFRIEFQLIDNSYEPVIVDLRLKGEEMMVKCRVVHASQESRKYYAVLDSQDSRFEQIKQKIDFISISFRTFFCSQRKHIDAENFLQHSFNVSIRSPNYDHDIVEATHVESAKQCLRDNRQFKTIYGSVWVWTTAYKISENGEQIDLLCPHLSQIFSDLTKVTEKMTGTFAIMAQFALSPGNVPMFLVRFAASTLQRLPLITSQLVSTLPPVHEVFQPLFLNSLPHDTTLITPTLDPELFNNRNSILETTIIRTESPHPTVHTEVATILNESEFERRLQGQVSRSPIRNESLPESGTSHSSSVEAEVINDSWLASTESTTSFSRMSVTDYSITAKSETRHVSERTSRFGYNGGRFEVNRSSSFQKKSNRPLKYGYRKLATSQMTTSEALFVISHKFQQYREMFVERATEAINSWKRRPTGKIASTKKRIVSVYCVEVSDFSAAYNRGECCFTKLARCFTRDDVDVTEKSFVVPLGGEYPNLPKNHELGQRLIATHYSFNPDRMVRLGGHAYSLGGDGLRLVENYSIDSVCYQKDDGKGHKWIQIKTTAFRPGVPDLANDSFEIWSGFGVPGYIIVENINQVRKCLAPLDPEYVQDLYSLVIEPLPGGPIDISSIDTQNSLVDQAIIFWRMVVEFTEEVKPPQLLDRRRKDVPPTIVVKREKIDPKQDIENYGMYKTMAINQQLAQERIDRLRALGDPRIKIHDGPELNPEMKKRKVDLDSRRENLFNALLELQKELPQLKKHGFLNSLDEAEIENMREKCEALDDNHHPHQFKKRTCSLSIGCNYLAGVLVKAKLYKTIYESRKCVNLLATLSDCIGLNSTYITKSPEVKRMLLFMFQKKLHKYI